MCSSHLLTFLMHYWNNFLCFQLSFLFLSFSFVLIFLPCHFDKKVWESNNSHGKATSYTGSSQLPCHRAIGGSRSFRCKSFFILSFLQPYARIPVKRNEVFVVYALKEILPFFSLGRHCSILSALSSSFIWFWWWCHDGSWYIQSKRRFLFLSFSYFFQNCTFLPFHFFIQFRFDGM